ncbi:MAG: hypothetical protein AB1800_05255 [Pseudomonadota bacterium]
MRAVAILMLFWAGAALADQNGAFQDGKSLGGSVNQGAFSGINSGAASDKIPSYGTNPSETQFFQGGQGQLSGPGISKMQNCATATPDSDPIKRQECEAVNFLARNPQVRPQFNITKNDPMIIGAKNARNSAESFFQAIGIDGGAGSSSQCTTRTETTPAQYTTETCSSAKEIGTQQCTMGRVINIDTDANFQCEQTINAYESLKCRRGSSVTVGFGQCTPGAWLGRVAYVDCSWCVDPYMAMNIYCGSDGRSYRVNPYRSYDGVNRYDYNWIGYPWDGSYGYFNVAVAPGQSVVDYYVSNLGFGCNLYVYYSVSCGTSTCTPSIRGVSSGCNAASGSGTGAPLQLPLTKTISNWTSDQCMALKARTQ